MEQINVRPDQLVTLWKAAGHADRQTFLAGLPRHWQDEMPAPRDDMTALRDALGVLFRGSQNEVKRTSHRRRLELLFVTPGDDGNQYDGVLTIELTERGFVLAHRTTLELAIVNRRVAEIQMEYDRERERVTPREVTRLLVTAVGQLRGLKLRRDGGLYFIPAENAGAYTDLANALERLGSTIYRLNVPIDADTVRTVRDALAEEVDQTIAAVREQIDGNSGKRALENAKEAAIEQTRKIRDYERLLGETLTSLTTRVEQIEHEAATAALAAAAEATKDRTETAHAARRMAGLFDQRPNP